MSDGNDDGDGGLEYVDTRLCESQRETLVTRIDGVEETLTTKIDGLRNTIVAAVSLSTAVISIIVYILNLKGG